MKKCKKIHEARRKIKIKQENNIIIVIIIVIICIFTTKLSSNKE